PNTTLLEWLRSNGLTGSKEGCAEGDCGACSVAIVDRDARGKRCYRAINSCLVPLPLMAGREIISVEGVACPKMHPVQKAMLENLFRAVAEHPDACLIAGATDLGLEITKRFQRFPVLISLEAVAELNETSSTDTEWRIGAATTLTKLDDVLGADFPEIREMLSVFGSRQIRNRATLGGNLVTASPIGDSAPVLLALDADVVIASATGERILPLDEFFVAYRKTALQPGEILQSVVLPRPQADIQTHRRFFKVSKRREMDISTVAACFAVALDQRGIIT